ncbi:MAG TPA: endonuclease Q family protein [Dissulfurispiraceae bacterium]
MRFVADLHIHSHYSRATSREMSPEALWRWAQLKGITVIGTGDFTHPGWVAELKEKIEPAAEGLFGLKKRLQSGEVPASCRADVRFLLSAEISCIYRKNGKTRKVHAILFAPGFGDAERIAVSLAKIGNLRSDGRPILGLDAKELLRIVKDTSPEAMLVPAHVWTPHFSVFGAASGFDTLQECFDELTPHIHAIETGLSSDPPMNWRLSALDRITLISNSDAHSPAKIGREANIFGTDLSYPSLVGAIKTRKGFLGTIEFFPEEGKYHNDGHRVCGVNLTPKETGGHSCRCPACGKKVTVGVMHRVEALSDRDEGVRPHGAPGFHSVIPLPEIIAEALGVGSSSKAVAKVYHELLERLGNEFVILLDLPPEEISEAGYPQIAQAVSMVRSGNVSITPGFDGEYGKIRIFGKGAKKE